ncbi:MAG: DUF3999 domain-containing protein [Desulfuromonadales bacterium]
MIRALCFTIVAGLLASAAAASPQPEDFAYGMRLAVSGNEAVHEFDLPEGVYRRLVHSGMADIAIFNAGGELVPFRIYPPPIMEAPAQTAPLPFFPLPAAAGKDDSLSVVVQRGPAGEILSLRQSRAEKGGEPAFLVDLTAVDRPVRALELEWNGSAAAVVGKVRVEGSDDLHRWQMAGEDTVATLQYGAHLLERRRIDLRAQRRYLRLTFQGVPETFRLQGVRAVFIPPRVEAERQWLSVPCRKLKENEYAFSLPGNFPVDRLRVRPPQLNTLVQAEVLSRLDEDSPWSRRTTALIYHLTVSGTLLRSPEVAVGATGHRFWLLRVEAAGGGMGEGKPEVEAGWMPHRVRFVARGSGPFLLAYGSGCRALDRLQADAALLQLSAERVARPGQATVGEEIVLGGETALRRSVSPQDWKSSLLWAALVASVLFLAGMAYALYRRIGRQEEQ